MAQFITPGSWWSNVSSLLYTLASEDYWYPPTPYSFFQTSRSTNYGETGNAVATVDLSAGSKSFAGAVLMKDGRVFCVPYDSTTARIYNPDTETVSTPSGTYPGSGAFVGGILLPDGKVFCVPHNSASARIYDPLTDTLSTPSGTYPGTKAFFGGVLTRDGKVFCVPYNSTTARIYDPTTDTLTTPTGTYPGGEAFSGGVLLGDGRIFCVPYSANFPLAYNPVTDVLLPADYKLPDITLSVSSEVSSTPLYREGLSTSTGYFGVTSNVMGATITITLTSSGGGSPITTTLTSGGGTQFVVYTSAQANTLPAGTLTWSVTMVDTYGQSTSKSLTGINFSGANEPSIGVLTFSLVQNGSEVGPTPMIFRVSRTGSLANSFTGRYTFSSGGSSGIVLGRDYLFSDSGIELLGYSEYTIESNQSSVDIVVPVINNDVRSTSSPRTLSLTLVKPPNYTISGSGVISASITEDDAFTSPPILSADYETAFVTEGDSGSSTFSLNISIDRSTTSAVTASFSTSNGLAIAGSDFTSNSGTITIPAGNVRTTVNFFQYSGDTDIEENEDLFITISNLNNAVFSNGQNSVTYRVVLVNDDPSLSSILIVGTSGEDSIRGGATSDYAIGGGGNDQLTTSGGSDTLYGGPGSDFLTGGTGTDYFIYKDFSESTQSAADAITDFFASAQSDRICPTYSVPYPTKLWNFGLVTGPSLQSVYKRLYNSLNNGQGLGLNESLTFLWGLSLSDRAGYVAIRNPQGIDGSLIVKFSAASLGSNLGEFDVKTYFKRLGHYSGGVLLPDGKVFCIPYGTQYPLVYDPVTNSNYYVNPNSISGDNKHRAGVLLPNNKVLGIPSQSTSAYVYDPQADTTTEITGVSGVSEGVWGGLLLKDGRVFLAPHESSTAVIYGSKLSSPLPDSRVLSAYDNKF